MLSFLIVGSGYRSEYYARIAVKYPMLFRALYLCRSEEKAALVKEHTGVPAVTQLSEALAFSPDFVVVVVDKAHIADVTEEWVQRGFAVLCETPAGNTREKLERLWELQEGKGGRIVCCEQYFRNPLLAAGLLDVEKGLLGDASSVYLSLLHDYHAASLLRRLLRCGTEEGYVMWGESGSSPVTETDSRKGASYEGRMIEEKRDVVHIGYASGKTAVYDFASVQYRSYIRSRHLTLRCERGEWSDRMIYYLDGRNCPQRKLLMPTVPEKYRMLDTQALLDERRCWQSELITDTEQDEYAIATILLDMEEYLRGGESPYPLEEALEDALFWLTLQEALENPRQEIARPKMPWQGK